MSASAAEKVIVKLGGEVVASPQLAVICAGVARLVAAGVQVIIVHGGGPQVSALQERLQIPVRKVAGRRYTDEDTLRVLKMVVAGGVNVDLCAGLRAAGVRPVGLHGAVRATRRPPRVYAGAGDAPIDLGLVGDVTGVDVGLLDLLLSDGRVPVLACLGVGEDAADNRGAGAALYNINADTVARSLARLVQARRLLLVSDVPVLRDRHDRKSRIPSLTPSQVQALIREGVVRDGMVAKLEEAIGALQEGLAEVVITADLAQDETVLRPD